MNRLFKIFKNKFSSKQIVEDLIKKNIKVESLIVEDVSGGCGQSFKINVCSSDFNGLSLIKQHKLLNEILSSELKEIHSVTYKTSVPSNNNNKI